MTKQKLEKELIENGFEKHYDSYNDKTYYYEIAINSSRLSIRLGDTKVFFQSHTGIATFEILLTYKQIKDVKLYGGVEAYFEIGLSIETCVDIFLY